jgi:hypothetical protein
MTEESIKSNHIHLQAADDFTKAKGKALLSQIQNFMTFKSDKLLSFNDVKDILKPKNQTYQGMQIIPINLIVGSEGRYHDFNKYFLPKSEHLRLRWEKVDMARITDVILPPIQLYEIGGVYFVRDGNHRVSVARTQGVDMIDAEVISLSSEIKIDPSMTTNDLLKAVIDYEKKIFYKKTDFGKLTDDYDLTFSTTGRYDEINNHILVHKYFINQNYDHEISFPDALVSWYNNVYQPIIGIIEDERLYQHFPNRTESDLYVWIAQHWDFLKKKYGVNYSLADAAKDFSEKYRRNPSSLKDYLSLLAAKFLRR